MSKRRIIIGKVLSIVSIIAIILFVISSAFIVQITFRPYYFAHVGPLGIEQSSGYSYEEIALAFNDVMDFIWLGAPFKTGNLAYTESGKEHFADCIPLFFLDLIVFIVTAILLITYLILIKTKVLPKPRILGFHPFFYASIVLLLFVASVLIIGLIDFDRLFVLFHSVLFPGKSNWIFDYDKDQIINILPESFFLCCGVFAAIVAGSQVIGMLVSSIVFKVKESKAKSVNS
ncbi:MAG: TIGR01906 family membrane protein [Bacilli bacterium]|nr:TIGR01906 family membrane protein [Bacilli bacterium]